MTDREREGFVGEFLTAVLDSDTPLSLDFNERLGNYAIDQYVSALVSI